MSGPIGSSVQNVKLLHEVFLQKGTNPSEVFDFIKSTVGHGYISPWSDADDELVSAQFKATQDQVKKMKDHKDIVRLLKVKLPVQDISTPRGRKSFVEGEYFIRPINRENADQCNVTGSHLSTILGDRLEGPTMSNGRIREWGAEMTDEEVAKVENLDGVEAVRRVYRGKRGRFLPRILKPSEASDLRGPKKRDVAYERQEAAATELVAISQPSTVPDLTQLKNYVYESHGGSGTFVYHVETGLAYKAQTKEFPNVAPQHLLTDKAIKKGDEPWVDDDDGLPSHGTCNAGKALGSQFGASKKATLVVVRLHAITHLEVQAAFELIMKDIDDHPERRKKSVISMALSFRPVWDQETVDTFRQLIADLFVKDIPLISIAGNDEDYSDDDDDSDDDSDDDDGRSDDGDGGDMEMLDSGDVDEYPGLMEGPDLPLIVVGSVNSTGQRSTWSKGGPHVTLHAVGQDILCLPREGDVPTMENGTSYAGPLVAGEVANLLTYDPVPFDTSDGNLVKNLKAYLQSDQASWERVDGIRVLWNGVTEEQNPREAFECNGVGQNTYVEGEGVTGLIKDTFCSDLGTRQGLRGQSTDVSRTYNKGTPNEVTLSITAEPGFSVNYNQDDCVQYLLKSVDECSSTDNNAANYKGGGSVTTGGTTYAVSPGSLRAAAQLGKQAGCESTYKALYNDYWVWGHGWASSDYGESLKTELKGCALLPDTWDFVYGLGDDGREWTARFRTGVFQKRCVGDAVGMASGFGEFGCEGSGRD